MNEQPSLELATPTQSFQGSWADWAGMLASIGCAVHCAAMPLVFAYLPALGLGWMAEAGFHRWMAMLCFLIALVAFLPGWQKHRSLVPALWGSVGLSLLMLGAFGMEDYCCPPQAASSHALDATDPDCEICATESQPVSGVASLLVPLAPFITPLGGLLLIVGHVANHRRNCDCDCHSGCDG